MSAWRSWLDGERVRLRWLGRGRELRPWLGGREGSPWRGRRGARPAMLACALAALALPNDTSRPAGARPGPDADDPTGAAWSRALAYLGQRQSADGALRSDVYGVLRAGASTTAAAVYAAALAPSPQRQEAQAWLQRALAFVRSRIGDDASDDPTYSAAFVLLALRELQPRDAQADVDALTAHLRALQLGPAQGWTETDAAFGGFALGGRPQRKPVGAGDVGLSTTSWVVEALHAAGVAPNDPVLQRALRFAERCQVLGTGTDADGGFTHQPPGAPLPSKAGTIMRPDGTERPRPYGSATADGVRTLLACGLPPSHPRVRAALAWLRRHDLDRVPGFEPNDPAEPALRLYWWASVARALAAAGEPGRWRERIVHDVLAQQREDGAFVGASDRMKEDDPLVATPLALLALAAAR